VISVICDYSYHSVYILLLRSYSSTQGGFQEKKIQSQNVNAVVRVITDSLNVISKTLNVTNVMARITSSQYVQTVKAQRSTTAAKVNRSKPWK